MIFHPHKKIGKFQNGQVVIMAIIFFTLIGITVVFGMVSPVLRQLKIGNDLHISKQSYFAAETASEDAYYRIRNNLTTSFPETLSFEGATTDTSLSIIGSNEKEIFSSSTLSNLVRNVLKDITVTDGFEFNFAVQSGPGGLDMQDNSKVIGNVYSSGPILGHDTSKNAILGTAVSAGSSGSINTVHATSSAYAHTISNSVVDKDAYYVTLTNTTVSGTKYPGSADQPAVPMPIADSLLDQWENDALSGGTISSPCPYTISSNVTLGPTKINCDVTVSGNSTVVTLAGSVWINGNLTVNNNPQFKVSDSLGNKSVPIIAHASSDTTNKSIVTVNNNPTFYGSVTGGAPNPDSYIMFISRNTSSENGGNVVAISAGNNVTGNLLLYAPHGEITLLNNVILREVTGHHLTLKNNTEVLYSVGLAQPLFTAGPGGQWKIKRWKESI